MSAAGVLSLAVAAALLTACTASPQVEPRTSGGSSLTGAPRDDESGDSGGPVRIRVAGYPDRGTLPPLVRVGDLTVKTDLDCRDQDRSGTPKVKIGLSGKALPSIAAAATQRLRGQRSVIVMQAHTMATVLVLNDDSSLIGSWTMQRYGTGWIWDSAHYCDGKLEEIVLT